MDVKKLPDAVRIVNWRAHEDDFVTECLKLHIRTGKFPDFGKNEKLFEIFMKEKYDIDFHIFENLLADVAEAGGNAYILDCLEDNPGCKVCDIDCPYLHKHLAKRVDADLNGHDIPDIIADLEDESQKLYSLKARICEAIKAPIDHYTEKNDKYYKVVNVEGYKVHLPVSDTEESDISAGMIKLVPDEERWPSRREFIDDASLEDAIAMINKRINECTH